MTKRLLLAGLAAGGGFVLCPRSAFAQSITSVPVTAVPAMPPWALLALGLVLLGGAAWLLRHRPFRAVAPLLSLALVAALAAYGPALWAAITLTFTNPAGETLAVPVTQIPSGGDLAGWELADFTNSSGTPLKVSAIVLPTLSQCLPGGLSGTLLPAGTPPPSPPQTCAVGLTLADGDVCRVDVDTICRGLAAGHLATLSAITPTSGSPAGGTGVTLTGTNLSGATAVTFDGTAATAVTVVNATTVTASTPAHAAGAVDVVVTTPNGSATLTSGFTYNPLPTLTNISPTSGSTLGGTAVTLTGTNLTGATSVTFGGVAAAGVTVVNATTITATTPAHAAGAVDVVVTTPNGSATLASGYTYKVLPTLTAINPASGPAAGGTGFTLTGTNLTGTSAPIVDLDGIPATFVNVVSSTTVTGVTPAHAVGAVDVVINTSEGTATLTNGYTYVATAVGGASGGGVIAALNGGLNDLIAATADNGVGIEWGGFGTAVGAGAQSNTDGGSNTAAIVLALGNNGGAPYAAKICSDFQIDSQGNTPCQAGNACYDDWFLPAGNNLTATGQLNALFTNRLAIGGFTSGVYWSSTEFSADPTNSAWAQSFANGAQFSNTKDLSLRLRCVRAFTP